LQQCETSEGYDPQSNHMSNLLFEGTPKHQKFLEQACEVMDLALKDASSPSNPFALA